MVDPGTVALILGGAKAIGGFFGGRKEDRRRKEAEQRRKQATDYAKAAMLAKQMLAQELGGHVSSLSDQAPDLGALFADPKNPFARRLKYNRQSALPTFDAKSPFGAQTITPIKAQPYIPPVGDDDNPYDDDE